MRKKAVLVTLTENQHRQLKLTAIRANKTMKDLMAEMVERYLEEL
jgi:hypothetical protein